jgi:hypothetical protein
MKYSQYRIKALEDKVIVLIYIFATKDLSIVLASLYRINEISKHNQLIKDSYVIISMINPT